MEHTQLIYKIGRTWGGAPQPWKNFCRSLPTHQLLRLSTCPTKQAVRLHMGCMRKTLAKFDARYKPSSRRHPARILFNSWEGKCAWMLAYA